MWMRYNEEYTFEDENEWYYIVTLMDDEKREATHLEVAPCTNRVFLEAYLEKDPEFEQLLAQEFGIEWF